MCAIAEEKKDDVITPSIEELTNQFLTRAVVIFDSNTRHEHRLVRSAPRQKLIDSIRAIGQNEIDHLLDEDTLVKHHRRVQKILGWSVIMGIEEHFMGDNDIQQINWDS